MTHGECLEGALTMINVQLPPEAETVQRDNTINFTENILV